MAVEFREGRMPVERRFIIATVVGLLVAFGVAGYALYLAVAESREVPSTSVRMKAGSPN